jgi:hypothetical protein
MLAIQGRCLLGVVDNSRGRVVVNTNSKRLLNAFARFCVIVIIIGPN